MSVSIYLLPGAWCPVYEVVRTDPHNITVLIMHLFEPQVQFSGECPVQFNQAGTSCQLGTRILAERMEKEVIDSLAYGIEYSLLAYWSTGMNRERRLKLTRRAIHDRTDIVSGTCIPLVNVAMADNQ